MLIQLTPDDMQENFPLLLDIVRRSLPPEMKLSAHAEWFLFAKTQVQDISAFQIVRKGEDGELEPVGYIIGRHYFDDIFMQGFFVLYAFELLRKPSAELIQDTWQKLCDWARSKGIGRIEAYTNAPILKKIMAALGMYESSHFTKIL